MAVYVISKNGERLMPTIRYGRVRRLLKSKQAHITGRKPFTIQLDYETANYVQELELCVDAGAQHIGLSLKSDAVEYESIQFDLLPDEKEKHDDQRRYRRTRRNHKRYRKCRFNNRRKKEGWLAPSLQNKADRHIDIILSFVKVAPISDVYVEVGQFDTQLLSAIQEGKPIPLGTDYQHGERYQVATLREAVFQRDNYTCKFCGKSAFDKKKKVILHAHHAYYWRGQHGNRLEELVTCCTKCHTSANHQKDGLLWGYGKPLPRYVGAAFMNSVKWYIYNTLKKSLPCNIHLTYGAATKCARSDLNLEKSHVNDAYAMGRKHPPVRAAMRLLTKKRRNNRVLEKFYDATILHHRVGEKRKGKDLSCGRTKRSESRTSDKSLRKFRGKKIKKGRRNIRKHRYPIRPGDLLKLDGRIVHATGVHCNGDSVIIQETGKSKSIKKVEVIRHVSGWA